MTPCNWDMVSLGPLFPTIYPIHFTSSKHLVFSKLKTQKIPVHAQFEMGNQWFCFRQCFAHQSIYYTCLTAVYIPFLEPLQYPNNTGSEPSSSNVDRLSCLFVFAFFHMKNIPVDTRTNIGLTGLLWFSYMSIPPYLVPVSPTFPVSFRQHRDSNVLMLNS